jgi:mRNA interferase RelE/StbE
VDRDLEKLPVADQRRILEAIFTLGDAPKPYASRKLQNRDGYRLRVGKDRALYLVDEGAKEVTVTKVAHRREVYRG